MPGISYAIRGHSEMRGDAHQLIRRSGAGWSFLALAAAWIIVTGPGAAPVILAGAAAVFFALDPRLGPLAAGLLVTTALPYGRGADTLTWQVADVSVRPQDAALLVAIAGGAWLAYRNRSRWPGVPHAYLAAFTALFAVGLVALAVGLTGHNHLRDVVRDLRLWVLFAAGILALLSGTSRHAVLRGLLLGATALAVVIVVTAVLPAFNGGIKAQTLVYDRGTLRMQFGNSIFLIPTIGYAAWRLMLRWRPLGLGWLVLLVVAVVLSLTRMSILATLGVVILAGLLGLVGWPTVRRHWRRTVGTLAGAVVLAAAIGVTLNLIATPSSSTPATGSQSGSAPQTALDRFLGHDASDVPPPLGARSGRVASYLAAYALIQARPAIGSGMGSLIPVAYAYSSARAYTIAHQPSVDDAYLTMAVKAGVVGVSVLATLLVLPLLSILRSRRRVLPWFIAGWVGVLFLTLPQAFAMSGYGPFGLSLVAVLPVLQRSDDDGRRPRGVT